MIEAPLFTSVFKPEDGPWSEFRSFWVSSFMFMLWLESDDALLGGSYETSESISISSSEPDKEGGSLDAFSLPYPMSELKRENL